MIETIPSLQQSQRQAQLHARLARAAITLAQHKAKAEVKLALRRAGKKLAQVPTRELTRMAQAYLASHPELIDEARPIVEQWRVEGFFGKRAARAAQNSTNLHKSRRADLQRLSLCKCQVQNGELNHRSPRAGFRRQANARRATGDSASRPRRSSLIQAEIAE
jgi:hypothetical protein